MRLGHNTGQHLQTVRQPVEYPLAVPLRFPDKTLKSYSRIIEENFARTGVQQNRCQSAKVGKDGRGAWVAQRVVVCRAEICAREIADVLGAKHRALPIVESNRRAGAGHVRPW